MGKGKSTLGGAARGAAVGGVIGGPVGAGIGAGVGGLLGYFGHDNSDELAMEALEQNREIWEGVRPDDLTWKGWEPEDYKYAGDFKAVEGKASQVSEDPMLRSAQLSALSKMAGLADTGLSEVDEAAFNRARSMGAQMARSGREAAVQDAQARGVGGSGLEFALREIANQQGAGRAQQAGLDQAAEAAKMRALYNEAFGRQLAGVRDQDFRSSAYNADALNAMEIFNKNWTNQAELRNVDTKQDVYNRSGDVRNQAGLFNAAGQNATNQQNVQNQFTWAGGASGANTGVSQGHAAQGAANQAGNNAFMGLAGTLGAAYLGSKKGG